MKDICDYGCNQLATFTFKNGKNCCSKNTNYCPTVVKKNIEKHKGKTPSRKCLSAARKARKGAGSWNKGLTKETDERVAKNSTAVSQALIGKTGTKHSKETKNKLSVIAKKRKLGGYVKGSGRGKSGWYKGFYCDSSWELAYVIYCIDHNIKIERNKQLRKYKLNGEEKGYIPDFIVDGVLIEIKGYRTIEWEAKHRYNPDVKVLYEKDLKEVFDYVKNKYGTNFINLYEKIKEEC